MSVGVARKEITASAEREQEPCLDDFATALSRTKVTAVDDDVQAAIDLGDFRRLEGLFPYPTHERIVGRRCNGPGRFSGGPGTGNTIVALHRVGHLTKQFPRATTSRFALTIFTNNLTTDVRLRLASSSRIPTRWPVSTSPTTTSSRPVFSARTPHPDGASSASVTKPR
jgi:hypothetical protein